jgi:cell fate regulator YaaT (PSP1 superfamily)
MAKMQKATLDPSKISGYCGRLKCCLRYEDQTYTELKKRLPKKNSRVKTSQGPGRIVDTQILTQLVMVEYDTGGKTALPVEEIEQISPPTSQKKTKEQPPQENKKTGADNNNSSEKQDNKKTQQ